jgi:hypothetical protein
LICHEEDRVSSTLEEAMRYLAMIGWMAFNQMAMMNAHIPLYGDENYEQLRSDIVDHDERLEDVERRYRDIDEELTQMDDCVYRDMDMSEEQINTLERMLEVTQVVLGRVMVEMMWLRVVVNTNNTRLVVVLHGRENPVVVEDTLELEVGPS